MAKGFKRAVRSQAKGRIGLVGPAGSGKTYTALLIASGLGSRIALIDSEQGSSANYADLLPFDMLELTNYHPQQYIDAIKAAKQGGYDALIIDSLSHAWSGPGGALDLAESFAAKYKGNKFAAWRDVTPLHNALVDAMLTYPGHLIVTMRSKTEYVLVDEGGKKVPKKVGMAPIQRDGMEYEFGLVAEIDIDHNFIVTKTRYAMFDGLIAKKPGKEIGEQLALWLSDAPPPEPEPEHSPAPPESRSPSPPPAPANSNGDGPSQAQMRRLFAIARANNIDVRKALMELFNKSSPKDLALDEYNRFCAWAESAPDKPV